MYILKLLTSSAIKYIKGLLLLACPFLIFSTGIFVFDSCKKNQYDKSESGIAAKKFLDALNANKNQIGSIILEKETQNQRNQNLTTLDDGTLFLDFPIGTDPAIFAAFNNNTSIQAITDALYNYNIAVQDTANAQTDISLQIPTAQITTSLQPLVIEAKNYLISKGFTNQTIQDMIQEEGVTEIELIPFVKVLTAIEQNQYAVRKFNIPLINSAMAIANSHFLECGLAALGGDALYSLSLSGASSWTWYTMKSVFKSVAKRFLGPIGVAFAVVSFGICMLQ